MPGSMPATSQLDWLISITAMIVLFWSRTTRDLLKACPGESRGRSAGASCHSIVTCSDKVAIPRRPPHRVSRSPGYGGARCGWRPQLCSRRRRSRRPSADFLVPSGHVLCGQVRSGLVWGFSCQAVVLGCAESFLFGAGKAVFRPVACNQVPGARGRGQGTETLAELGGLPPSVACVSQRLDA